MRASAFVKAIEQTRASRRACRCAASVACSLAVRADERPPEQEWRTAATDERSDVDAASALERSENALRALPTRATRRTLDLRARLFSSASESSSLAESSRDCLARPLRSESSLIAVYNASSASSIAFAAVDDTSRDCPA